MVWEMGLETLWNQSPTLLSGTSTGILIYLLQRLKGVEEKIERIVQRCDAHISGDIKEMLIQNGKVRAKDLIQRG